MSGAEYRVTKIEAAVDQLDLAIRLFLDHKAYIPAITLAGAAEELLARASEGNHHALKVISDKLLTETSILLNGIFTKMNYIRSGLSIRMDVKRKKLSS